MTTEIITQLGWHKEGFFAWSNGIYSDGAFQPITEDDICIHNGKKYHIKITEPTSFEVMRYKMKFRHTPGSITLDHWLDLFTKVYKDNAIVGFSYYVATLFRDLIVADTGYYFPILNLSGVKGGGKTAMAQSLTKLFGDLPYGPNIPNYNIADMADYVAQTRNALFHIDEYKNTIGNNKVEFLKGLCDGTGGNRKNIYKVENKCMAAVDSSIILTGQEMPNADIALFSRVISTVFSKCYFQDREKKLFNELKAVEKDGLTHITNEIVNHRNDFAVRFPMNLKDVWGDLERWCPKKGIENRIWVNWLIIIGTLRTIKDFVELPFSYEKAVVKLADMMEAQNDEAQMISKGY